MNIDNGMFKHWNIKILSDQDTANWQRKYVGTMR